jgi:Arc/MetJ family transcription regulator
MRTTINIDDGLLAEAADFTGITERTALIHGGLRELLQREAARRLAKFGGSQPRLRDIPRRRPDPA